MSELPYSHQMIDYKDVDEVVKVLKSKRITQGEKVGEFEKALCEYTGAKYAVAVSNGTAGLHLACISAGLKPGFEAITTGLTFLSTSNSILYCGAKPVFTDIDDNTGNLESSRLGENICGKTKAVIPVHYAGNPCNMKEIGKISGKKGLTVIEDATHALGAEYEGEKIGSCRYSDMAVFSFHPIKSMTTGEGGAILTNNKNFYKKLVSLRVHGTIKDKTGFTSEHKDSDSPWWYEMHMLGYNYRLTDIQCALGLSQLEKLDKFIDQRRRIAKYYKKKMGDIEEIILPAESINAKSSWHLYPLRVKNQELRGQVFKKLTEAGLGVQVHYIPVYLQPYYQNLGYEKGLCPVAEKYYEREISIPLFPAMTLDDREYVVESIKSVFENG